MRNSCPAGYASVRIFLKTSCTADGNEMNVVGGLLLRFLCAVLSVVIITTRKLKLYTPKWTFNRTMLKQLVGIFQ